MIRFHHKNIFVDIKWERSTCPVRRNAGKVRKRVVFQKVSRDFAKPGRVNYVQPAVEHKGIPNESALPIRSSSRRIVNLARVNRASQSVGANLGTEEFTQVSIPHLCGWN